MRRIAALLLTLAAWSAWEHPALASGDYGCGQSWKLVHRGYSCDNLLFLAPANDTRVNLSMLLLDRTGQSAPRPEPLPDPMFEWEAFRARFYPEAEASGLYAEGEGSRCRSNDSGRAAFEAAVTATRGLPAAERDALIAARRALQPSCIGSSPAAPLSVRSRPGQAFATYLDGARAFYGGDFDRAGAAFTGLAGADHKWLSETARYMVPRVELNRAQLGAFDEYGTLKGPDAAGLAALGRAEAGLRSYLVAYPGGRYAASAKGLLRRVYWLGGRTDRLAAEYAAALAALPASDPGALAGLAEEADDKLLMKVKPGEVRDPLLLAVLDLARMRTGGSDEVYFSDCCGPPLTRAQLEGQRPLFAGREDLFGHLIAAHAFYVANDPASVLRLIPDAARQQRFSSVQFSRQMLRGLALEVTRDRNARGFWTEMLGGARDPHQRAVLELALAMHDERAGALPRIFASGSAVRTPALRHILIESVAGPDLLRAQARDAAAPRAERELALFTLLAKSLGRGRHADFVRDIALVPADAPAGPDPEKPESYDQVANGVWLRGPTGEIGCPSIRETAARLARAPGGHRDRLCLAEFFRVNGFDGMYDTRRPADELGGTAELFPGKPFSRLELYKAIIADARAPADDKAYSLYRAVNCYAPSGSNSCGGVDVPLAVRRGWFQRLKGDYPASPWAKRLRYYW
jgi:hypothetical protein